MRTRIAEDRRRRRIVRQPGAPWHICKTLVFFTPRHGYTGDRHPEVRNRKHLIGRDHQVAARLTIFLQRLVHERPNLCSWETKEDHDAVLWISDGVLI